MWGDVANRRSTLLASASVEQWARWLERMRAQQYCTEDPSKHILYADNHVLAINQARRHVDAGKVENLN